MIGRSVVGRILRGGFRRQKTRLQVDWLTHTDELILKTVSETGSAWTPVEIADAIDRSPEYVADRCRQLELRALLNREPERGVRVRLAERGRRYLAGDIDADELADDVT